jgi:hypothetical protein
MNETIDCDTAGSKNECLECPHRPRVKGKTREKRNKKAEGSCDRSLVRRETHTHTTMERLAGVRVSARVAFSFFAPKIDLYQYAKL